MPRRIRRVVSVGLLVAVASIASAGPSADAALPANSISYGYDASGRLVTVIDPSQTNGVAKYAYDPAGDLTSITRQASSALSYVQTSPGNGPVGTTVMIYGTGFSSTPASNTVKFNGTAATVSAATTTELTTTVPSGATTGSITVKVGTTTVTSPLSFTVGVSGTPAPTVTGFSPSIGTAGTPVTVSGTNFSTTATDDVVEFDNTRSQVTSAAAGSLGTSAPPGAGSGHITVATPDGTAVSSGDFFVPPTGFTASDVLTTGRMAMPALDGTTNQAVSIGTTGKFALYLFDAMAGQTVFVNVTGSTMNEIVTLYDPTGVALANTITGATGYIDATTLQSTGTYEIAVQAINGTTGSLTLGLTNDNPVSSTITPTQAGSAKTVTLAAPGDTATYSFTGAVGQRIAWAFTNIAVTSPVTVYDPNGGVVVSGLVYSFGKWLETGPLALAGTYTIVFDPAGPTTGSVTMTSYNVPADSTKPITIDGAAVTGSNTTPGQNIRFTFTSPSAGKKVTVTLSSVTGIGSGTLSIFDTTAGTVIASTTFPSTGGSLNATLPSNVGYTILVDPDINYVGSVTATLKTGTFAGIQPRASRPAIGGAGSAAVHSLPTLPVPGFAAWTPNRRSLGQWKTTRPASPYAALPALHAPRGVTALAGQVLQLNGAPLNRVTLQVGSRHVTTDATGRFLLTGLGSGHAEMIIDGSSANTSRASYGVYEDGVDIAGSRTTTLRYTIWMTPLDHKHVVRFAYPIRHTLVVRNPEIPGLELRVPAGSVIKDRFGHRVTQLSITPIPTDRPPFPLPAGVYVPEYFTIQPGSAYLSKGARLIYPNFSNAPAHTRIAFWNYDPDSKGWYVYGHGTVSRDAKRVIPDPGVRIWELTGAMINIPGLLGDAVHDVFGGLLDELADPVNPGTGLFTMRKADLYEPGPMPLSLTRTYRQASSQIRPFGLGETFPYAIFLHSNSQFDEADLVLPNSSTIHYVRTSACPTPGQVPCQDFSHAVFTAQTTPSDWFGSTITWNGVGWNLKRLDGTTYVFGENAPLQAIIDRHGNRITISHANGGQGGNITRVSGPNGRWISFSYNSANCPTCISDATDQSGRTVHYTYDTSQRLTDVTDVTGGTTHYTWNNTAGQTDQILSITDPRQITYLQNQYDANDRVSIQTLANNGTYHFNYTTGGNGNITQTDVTDPDNNVTRLAYNADGFPISVTDAQGTAIAQTTTITRTTTTDRPTDFVDQRNRDTHLAYDLTTGDITSVTRLFGTPNAVTTNFTYDPKFNQLASIQDPNQHTSHFTYDGKGNLTDITNALAKTWHVDYNEFGESTAITDPLTNKTSFGYQDGDLASVTDPLGNKTVRFGDSAGRTTGITDAMGQKWRYTYDAANHIKKITDPLGNVTQYGYDPNGDLTSVIDARNNQTTYTYNGLGEVASMTDSAPVQRTAQYGYDPAGNLNSVTDRRGTITGISYDALERPQQVCYNQIGATCGSTVDYSFDNGNRLTKLVDSTSGSPSGTIDRTYDDLNQMLTETTTPQGSSTARGTVTYTYDAAGRRKTMQVAGQPIVNYGYDDADHLTSITQGSSTVTRMIDAAGKLSSVALPDGILETFGYTGGTELASITDTKGSTTLGAFQYGYNADQERIAAGGTFARTALPPAFTGTYNSANQLTSYTSGSTTVPSLSYDPNGNLQSDGTNTYTWDARNQLGTIAGGATASFVYDPFGRRVKATVNGQTSEYLYDRQNVIQEEDGAGAATANLLDGLGLDSTYARTDSSGQQSVLTDALGSAIALANGAGTIGTTYTYDPYGAETSTGTASSNTFQYTRRQNDGATGLNYYRARYYSPIQGRFVSQDPLGLAASSDDLYGYANDDPTDQTDPTGKKVGGPCITFGFGAVLSGSFQVCWVTSGTGQTGVTVTVGGGTTEGACANATGGATESNGTYIQDQGGWFIEGGGCAGSGLGGTGGAYNGTGTCGQQVVGGTGGVGPGVGLGATLQATRTVVIQLWGPDDPCLNNRKEQIAPAPYYPPDMGGPVTQD